MDLNLFPEIFLEFEICILAFILVFGTCFLEFKRSAASSLSHFSLPYNS